MGVAGIIARRRHDPALRFILVHATDGSQGEIAPGSGATAWTLGAVRRKEAEAGWAVVGRAPDRHEWLGLPDGGLDDLPEGLLADRIAELLEAERPDVVLTAGPDGISGHPDHIAVGRATTAAFLRFAGAGGSGFRRLLHAAAPQSAVDRINERRIASGRPAFDPARVYDLRGVPDEDIAVTVEVRDHVATIRDAFRAHRTQWAPPWTEMDDQEWVLAAGASHFVQAWPRRRPGEPRLSDVFDGIDL